MWEDKIELEAKHENSWEKIDYDGWSFVDDSKAVSPMMSIAQDPEPSTMQIYDGNTMVVTVDLKTGNVTHGENYTPTYAARLFWDAISSVYTSDVQTLAAVKKFVGTTENDHVVEAVKELVNLCNDYALANVARLVDQEHCRDFDNAMKVLGE